MPRAPIQLSQWTRPGLSSSPTGVAATQPSGSSCALVTSLIFGWPSRSTFLDRSGAGGGSVRGSGRTARVARHQTIMIAAIAVVAHMILRALSLDAGMPRTLIW